MFITYSVEFCVLNKVQVTALSMHIFRTRVSGLDHRPSTGIWKRGCSRYGVKVAGRLCHWACAEGAVFPRFTLFVPICKVGRKNAVNSSEKCKSTTKGMNILELFWIYYIYVVYKFIICIILYTSWLFMRYDVHIMMWYIPLTQC